MSPVHPAFTPPPTADVQPTRPTLQGTFGMAATTHWIASGTAMSVLERGGTAVDAACAAAFVLHVVEPHLNGPGGDVTGLVATADGAPPRVLMGQGPAPAGATPEHFRAEGLDLVPGAGALAAAVPGAVDAWLVLLRDLGTWELADVLGYATGYARHGHPVLAGVGTTVTGVAQLFAEHWPTSAALWTPSGAAPAAGSTITNPAHADVLDRLVAAGAGRPSREARIEAARSAWGEGFVADAVDAFVRAPHRHASGTDHAGVLRGEDMAAFSAGFEDAVTLDVLGATVAKTGPWGQGPVLLQALALLEGFDAADLDPSTPDGAHLVLEALKLALADRDAWYGDPGPDEDPVPLATLLSPAYTAGRRALIGADASHEVRPGSPNGRRPFVPPLREADAPGRDGGGAGGAAGEPTVRPIGQPVPRASGATRGDTCHLDVVDRWGTVVSATPSGGWLQSSPTIPELGFCLGTRLQMTWLEPGAPSSLRPGRRPRTTLTPTLVLREGRCVAGLGSPGGDQQDQWQLLYLLRTLVGGYSPQEAIDAPALHTTSMPGSFWPRTWTPGGAVVEDRLGEDVIGSLERRGHVVTRAGDWALGRLSVVTRDPATGLLQAAANPRGDQGYAVGR